MRRYVEIKTGVNRDKDTVCAWIGEDGMICYVQTVQSFFDNGHWSKVGEIDDPGLRVMNPETREFLLDALCDNQRQRDRYNHKHN